MCDICDTPNNASHGAPPLASLPAMSAGVRPPLIGERTGSRRPRLWELPEYLHCPVIGVCLPLGTLRRTVVRFIPDTRAASDYELHAGAVSDASRRTELSQALQRELEERYAVTVKRYAAAKSQSVLIEMWERALQGGDIAAHLWAAVTHARCDQAAHERIYRDVHMLQHQAGAMARADVQSLRELAERTATLERELAREHERCIALQEQRGAETAVLGAQLLRVRAELIGSNTQIAALEDELARLRAPAADLESRRELKQRVAEMAERQRELQRCNEALRGQVREAQADREAQAKLREAPADAPIEARADALPQPVVLDAPRPLEQRAVLCVGGRSGDVARYRDCIEGRGGRFLHHDGGIDDSPRLLDSSLAAADLVVCQTACISHNAYWLVKEHCKRTGKRCVFLERPSVSALARGLTATAGEPA